jgi:hypothetical protein
MQKVSGEFGKIAGLSLTEGSMVIYSMLYHLKGEEL